jgi:hypothetical protein
MKMRFTAFAALLALGLACAEQPVGPRDSARDDMPSLQLQQPGSGLELENITGVALPLIGSLGEVVIDEAIIANFAIVEGAVGQIVGVEAEGVLQLTGGILGTEVVTENFRTIVSVTSSGPGQCDLVTLDLGPIDVSALVAEVNVPAATVTGRGSGAVGSLLCNLGQLLNPVTNGARGVVQALNRLI